MRFLPLLLVALLALPSCTIARQLEGGQRELAPSKTQEMLQGYVENCTPLALATPSAMCPFTSDDGLEGFLVLPQSVAMTGAQMGLLGNHQFIRVLGNFNPARTNEVFQKLDPDMHNQALRHKFFFYVESAADMQRVEVKH